MIHTPVSYQGSVDALQGGLKPLQCETSDVIFQDYNLGIKELLQGFATKHSVL